MIELDVIGFFTPKSSEGLGCQVGRMKDEKIKYSPLSSECGKPLSLCVQPVDGYIFFSTVMDGCGSRIEVDADGWVCFRQKG